MWVREAEIMYKGKARRTKQLKSPEDVHEFFLEQANSVVEHFFVIALNNKNGVLFWQEVSRGTVSEALIHPREVFRAAVGVGASGILIVHNHPSGVVEPSPEDVDTTIRLKESGTIIGIPLVDHLIVSNSGYYSFKEHGQL